MSKLHEAHDLTVEHCDHWIDFYDNAHKEAFEKGDREQAAYYYGQESTWRYVKTLIESGAVTR